MSNIVPAVSYAYKWLGENVKDDVCDILGRKVRFYEVHDQKMSYAVTAHSTLSRLYHSFCVVQMSKK